MRLAGVIFVGVGAVYLIALILNFMSSDPVFAFSGKLEIYEARSKELIQTKNNEWRSDDCGINASRQVSICANFKIDTHTVSTTSANCGSHVNVSKQSDTCLVANETLKGCGVQRILGIRNCKGRGWLAYSVKMSGSEIERIKLHELDLSDNFSSTSQFEIPKEFMQKENVTFEWNVEIRGEGKQEIIQKLTSIDPSSETFSTQISDGKFIISKLSNLE